MLLLSLALSCAPYPEGLKLTPSGTGPMVKVDWDAKPLPNVPFPTDLATRTDPTSPTGLRLNVPVSTVTRVERRARERLNTMTGFGVYAPLSVPFEAPLDVANLAARHRDDEKVGADAFTDDAVLVFDVTPGSPDYGMPVSLDFGSGIFPLDVPNPARYFPNDPRDESPTLVFETYEEDLNGNGVLDWGEDTDNDGVLDHPNVYPVGGDPRDDLLTFYEYQSNTLMMRPVRPLREKTTYAVVLTTRLLGADGEPVRSPWEYVHHLRQTEALRPLDDALPNAGLSLDDVAFAWTFTTGDVTGELRAARKGLLGEGTLAALDAEFPAGVRTASAVHDTPGEDPVYLPGQTLLDTLLELGLFPSDSADALAANFGQFTGAIVGGAFETPNFMGEPGEAPAAWPAADDSNDSWQLDAVQGTYQARAERVIFSCALPKDVPQPAPVVVFGHGYGSSRFDFLGFAWAMNRVGMAACAFDYPGHGPTVGADEEALISAVLKARFLLPFYEHLKDSRYRDLDNDGVKDSGGDQWTADAFHTRDMVRQAALDHAQFIDTLRACGEGDMLLPDGSARLSCDWDNDGTPDVGGEDVELYQFGGSLGGINTVVAAGVIDEVKAWAPVVPGGSLLDVALRTDIGGAVEAMHGRLMSPLFLGRPEADGTLRITQMVNSVHDMVELPVGALPSIPAGGRVVVENLTTGVSREGYIPEDGTFRLGIAADAASAWEKQSLANIPVTGAVAGVEYPFTDPMEAGDALRLTFYDANGAQVAVVDSWGENTNFQGATYVAGTPLVAAAEGLGYIRGTPELRRVAFVFGAVLEPGDPIGYARSLVELPAEGSDPRNILVVPTLGDTWVNINAGIGLARSIGLWDVDAIDDRYGTTIDRWLVEKRVIQGLEEFGPYTDVNGASCLFDPDDLDNGTDGTGAPSEAPLRVSLDTPSGVSGLRLPYVRTTGTHGFATPEPDAAFDLPTFMSMQIATYFQSGGTVLSDDMCLEDASCEWLPQLSNDGSDTGAQ